MRRLSRFRNLRYSLLFVLWSIAEVEGEKLNNPCERNQRGSSRPTIERWTSQRYSNGKLQHRGNLQLTTGVCVRFSKHWRLTSILMCEMHRTKDIYTGHWICHSYDDRQSLALLHLTWHLDIVSYWIWILTDIFKFASEILVDTVNLDGLYSIHGLIIWCYKRSIKSTELSRCRFQLRYHNNTFFFLPLHFKLLIYSLIRF